MDDLHTNLSHPPADLNAAAVPSPDEFMVDFLTRFRSESEKNQLQLVDELTQRGESGLNALMSLLLERQAGPVGVLDGKIHQMLVAADTPSTQAFLQTHVPQGVVPLRSHANIDYAPLAHLLAKQDFLAADRVTLEKLCELAGESAVQRRWVYFTEVERFPTVDLQTINTLWQVYSEGKFGFSVQRELWLGVGRDWERLWERLGWKKGNIWTRYPQEFTWSLEAPRGHLPLNNQLRGVRVFASLLTHPAWTTPQS